MAKPTIKTKKVLESAIERAAKAAAEDAIQKMQDIELEEDQPDVFDMQTVDEDFDESGPETIIERDVFSDAPRKATLKNDGVRFYIYKNSEFVGIKNQPYSWEQILKEMGRGHYKIVAKSVKTGTNIMVQSELVGSIESTVTPEPVHEVQESAPSAQMGLMEMMAFMNGMNEKAETKLASAQGSQSTAMVTMMQFMMQSQQQSQQQFQALMMEMNKQSQEASKQNMSLVTSLLMKGSSEKAYGPMEMFKMIQDASNSAEIRTQKFYDLLEKKTEELAEKKAELYAGNSEGEESLSKTLIKSFIPALAQFAGQTQGQAPQSTEVAPREVETTRLNPRIAASHPTGPALREERGGFIKTEQNNFARPANFNQTARPVQTRQVPTHVEDLATNKTNIAENQAHEANLKNRGVNAMKTKEKALDQAKANIIELIQVEIGQGILLNKSAIKTADLCLKKLEKAGILRQNVLNAFSLEDCYSLARQYGVLEKAKPWITEFYDHLATEQALSGASASTNGRSARSPREASTN